MKGRENCFEAFRDWRHIFATGTRRLDFVVVLDRRCDGVGKAFSVSIVTRYVVTTKTQIYVSRKSHSRNFRSTAATVAGFALPYVSPHENPYTM